MIDWYIAMANIWYFSNIGTARGGTFIFTSLRTAVPEHSAHILSLLLAIIIQFCLIWIENRNLIIR